MNHKHDDKSPPASTRRDLLKSALIGGAAAAGASTTTAATAPATTASTSTPTSTTAAYVFFTPAEATWIEAVVDHMVPADALSPKGSDLGIAAYLDRALEGSWGKGDRMYLDGPWAPGVPAQGYQLPHTPARLMRAGIAGAIAYSQRTYGKPFEQLAAAQKDELLNTLSANRANFEGGLSSSAFFNLLYNAVVEGMFCDPVYGGNVNKAGWAMLGFPGVIATHARNIVTYRNKPYKVDPMGLSDAS